VGLVLVPARASAESLCTDSWAGPGEGEWSTAADWSGGHVPGSTDVACVGTGKVVTITGGTNHAGVIQGLGSVSMAGGSLEVANSLEPSSIAKLSVEGAVLTGPAAVDVTGTFTGGGGGALTGSGSLTIESGATGSITATSGSSLELDTRTLANDGTLTVAKGSGLRGSGHADLINGGTLIVNGNLWPKTTDSSPPQARRP
jgi:hypothetical protein